MEEDVLTEETMTEGGDSVGTGDAASIGEATGGGGTVSVNTVQAQAPPPAPPSPPGNGNGNGAIANLQAQVEELTAQVTRLVEFQAEQAEPEVVQDMGHAPRDEVLHIHGMRTGLDQVEVALDALMVGRRPPDGIQPLTGIRELYHLLSGDFNMTGLFQRENVYLANVTASTMAGLCANAMNKIIVNQYAQFPKWWLPAVTEMDFTSLQDVRWITLGGVGELPIVSPGSAYTELTWDDKTETDSFGKRGGYLGITMESFDKDNVSKMRAAPGVIAQGAWLTLGKSIAAIFTANSGEGPAMSDGNNLFDATNHGNLSTSTILSADGWDDVTVAMMEQTELNSGERLGALTRAHLLWVPIKLEKTGLQLLASEGEPGTTDNAVNVEAEGETREQRLANARSRLIVCPFWTDANNWAAQANRLFYPSIGIGYRFGREPEVVSVASPTAGLMFTNDVMPIKVRFVYAVGPIDWRGLYKCNNS